MGILTHPDTTVYSDGNEWEKKFKKSKVHIQWDPECDIYGYKKEIRSVQVGIGKELIETYNNEWILEIKDLSPLVKKINMLRKSGKYREAKRLLPNEKIYPTPKEIKDKLGMD